MRTSHNENHKPQIQQRKRGTVHTRGGLLFHAAAIRHVCAYGHLTAHPNKCEAGNVEPICHELSDFILSLIREDFVRRLKVARATG